MFGFSNCKSFRFGGLGEWKADDTGETEFVIELLGELCKDRRVTGDTIELLGGAGGRRKRLTTFSVVVRLDERVLREDFPENSLYYAVYGENTIVVTEWEVEKRFLEEKS